MKIFLLIIIMIFPIVPLCGQEQKVVRIHRNPHTGEIWTKPVHLSKKAQTSRISLSYQGNLSHQSFAKLLTLEGSYAYQWSGFWPEAFASLTTGSLLALNQQTTTPSKIVTLYNFGLGISHQSHTIQKFLKIPNAFESINVGVGYYTLQGAKQEAGHGPGLKTDFKTFFHTSSNLHYGFKFSYHLAHLFNASPVKLFSWLSVGLDVAYYF